MSTIFIIHGVGGHPGENWFPWLHDKLQEHGHKVIVPQFPTPEGQTLENWLAILKNYANDLTHESILIGHSLGGAFILNVLEHYSIHAAFLVAPVFGILNNDFDDGMRTFTQREFDWPTILDNCPHFEIFHSENDPYVPLLRTTELSRHLNTPITLISGGGHLNASAGFTKFELLLEKITDLES